MGKRFVARHGQNIDNANGILNGHRDLPLTGIGWKQALELAQGIKLLGLKFAAVYSSPLSRAFGTAQTITDMLGLPAPIVLPGLIERDFGCMTGLPVSEIESRCAPHIIKAEHVTYFLEPEGAESFLLLHDRARRVLREVDLRHTPDEDVLLVTHGDIGKMLYAAYYNVWWMKVLTDFHFGNSELLELSPAAQSHERHVVKIQQHN